MSTAESNITDRAKDAATPRLLSDPWIKLLAFGVCLIPMWIVLHPFSGIVHDSTLYTLSALARLHPALTNDIFLRFGSQDQYTIFSPLYAAAIHLMGLEPAAATLTFLTHVAFFTAAWLLARKLMPANMALLGVGLLMAIPSGYGAYYIFNYVEGFLTPRQPAEAFVLAALAFAIDRKYVLTVLCAIVAALLHPIMAAAGIAMLLVSHFAISRPKQSAALALSGLMLVIALSMFAPVGPFRQFDYEWLRHVQSRSPFSFILLWKTGDWERAALPLSVFVVGMLTSVTPAIRLMCRVALITALIGMGLTLIGSDLLQIVILTQVQPWRWLWLANVCAILLTPAIAAHCWKMGLAGRASILFFAAAWVLRGQGAAASGIPLIAALVTAAITTRVINPRYVQWIFRGSCLALLLALVICLQDIGSFLTVQDDPYDDAFPLAPVWARDGILPIALLLLVWWLIQHSRTRTLHIAVISLTAVMCAVVAPAALTNWAQQRFSQQTYAAFGEFRRVLPQDAEVLWPASPLSVWYLLERASYLSIHQAAGVVFSRPMSHELLLRARQTAALLPPDEFGARARKIYKATPISKKLSAVCAAGDPVYVVSWIDLGSTPVAVVTPNSLRPKVQARLYSCAAQKQRTIG